MRVAVLVGNDADRIAALREVIDLFGYPVLIYRCETLEEAIVFIRLQPEPVELLFVDLKRDEADGEALLEGLQQLKGRKGLVISVLNAFETELPRRVLWKAGVKYFLTAPIVEEMVLWNVGMALAEGM
jgi:response regulator RpfG family c-di-GMP phosphodiesterase